MNAPLVSIVVPSYNHAPYIEECITSIFENRYDNIQVVVIDDGSTDGSAEILRELNKKYDFKLVLKPRSKGLVDSLNTFLEKYCKGEIYKPVSSDDTLVKDCLLMCVHQFTRDANLDIVIGNAMGIDADSRKVREYRVKQKGELSYKNFLLGNITYNITAAVYRTRIHKTIGLYKVGAVSEDIYFNRLVWKHCSIKMVDFYISGYRTHQSNISRDSWLMYKEGLNALKDLESDEYYELKKKREYLNFFASLSSNYKKESLKYLGTSLLSFPDRLLFIGLSNLLGLSTLLKKIRTLIPR